MKCFDNRQTETKTHRIIGFCLSGDENATVDDGAVFSIQLTLSAIFVQS